MAHRIEIETIVLDTRALTRKKKLQSIFGKKIKGIHIVDVYTIDKKLGSTQLKKAADILTNPLTQKSSLEDALLPSQFSYAIEIGFLPGVTDNIGNTAKEIIQEALKTSFSDQDNVYSSQITFIEGDIEEKDALKIGESLANPLIQRIHIKSFKDFKKSKGMGLIVPRVTLDSTGKTDEVNLEVDDEELLKIGKSGIANKDGTRRGPLALDLAYMKTIQKYFRKLKRNPTDIELESIAQTWSEHCKHTIFADPIDELKDGLYKTYIKAATNEIRKKKGKDDICVSVFTDNSGAIKFDKDFIITHKVETHNSPSALDPFGGAITGIVGVNRDAIGFGLGAKPVANIYGYCFGDPRKDTPLYKGANFTQKMLPARRIMEGVIDGVNSGGNCSGIPTPQGFVFFDDRYQGKPLVFVGTVGLLPKKINGKKSFEKKAQPGDYIVVIGGRVGQDGIHGATFSSEALDTGSPATAVQIGDPITQKKLSDAVVKEARNLQLYNSITDNGAGGISCSVAEMAKEAGGFHVVLDDVPLKYPGLNPWQIWISESQERMTLSIPKSKWKAFAELMKRRGVEATIIGTFNNSGKCVVEYKGKKIMNMDMSFLHNGLPARPMRTSFSFPIYKDPHIKSQKKATNEFLSMLSRLNITSTEFISQQYDHEVQAGSVVKPLQGKGRVNGDASAFRPVPSSQKGVLLSQGLAPTYSDIDTHHMAGASIDTAIRNIVAMGADIEKIALLDNFCWCSSFDPYRLRQLKRAVQACYEYALAYETPFISGKDSMFNDFAGFDAQGRPVKISIPPTLLVSSISVVDDVSKVVTIDLKYPGDLIYALGETHNELGASEYYALLGERDHGSAYIGNHVPKVDAKRNRKLYASYTIAVQNDLIASSISVGRGGLAVALAKTSLAGMLGINVSLKKLIGTHDSSLVGLFSESQGRMVVSINPKNKKKFEEIMEGSAYTQIGEVTQSKKILISGNKEPLLVNTSLIKAMEYYKSTFKNY